MVAPSSQGKSEVAISEGFRGAAPCRNCQAIKSLHHTHHHHFRFETPILYPFYFKVLTENPFSTKFVFRSASRKPMLTRFPLFLLFFYSTNLCLHVCFVSLIFPDFLQFSWFWTILKLLWNNNFKTNQKYFICSACSVQLEAQELAAQRDADDDDQRNWKRDQASFWQKSAYLSFLPTWTSRAKQHQTPNCFLFEILNDKAKFPPNKRMFFLFQIWCQNPTKQKPFFCCFCFFLVKKTQFFYTFLGLFNSIFCRFFAF